MQKLNAFLALLIVSLASLTILIIGSGVDCEDCFGLDVALWLYAADIKQKER